MSVSVGLIGYGLAGSAFHAPVLAAVPRLRLAAIATSRAEAVAKAWPDARAMGVEALLDDPDIDLVVIASPNDSHAPLAKKALERGKHVVIDKPFVTDPADGAALIALARAQGRVLSVYQNRRWDSDFLAISQAVSEGTIGDVALYEACWDRFRPAIKPGWREAPGEGAGLLADLGPHLIDQALALFGAPEAVSADIAAQRDAALVDDYFAVTLHYGARRAVLGAASLVAAARPRFAVHGTAGSLVSRALDPQEAQLRAGMRPGATGYGVPAAGAAVERVDGSGTSTALPVQPGDYRRFYVAIADAILEGAPPPVDPADALAGLRVIELARESAVQGRRIAWSDPTAA